MGFGADLLKNVVTKPANCQNRSPHTSKIGKQLLISLTNNRVEATTFLSRVQNLVNCGRNHSRTDVFTNTQTDGKS